MIQLSLRHSVILGVLSLAVIARAAPPGSSPSPSADTELICPSDNQIECYPRHFQPTKDFQTIKEGQDIPPGLHVRMNVWTGEKEARLNIPMEGEDIEGVIEVPLEQAVVVVPQPEETQQEVPSLRDQILKKAPAYEAAGKVQPPRGSDGTDSENFRLAIQTIKSPNSELSSALDELSDLAHDIYYGSELAKDSDLLEKLICLMTEQSSKGSDHKAASVIGSAIQNNPTALAEISKFWKQIMYPACGGANQENLIIRLRSIYGPSKADVIPDAPTLKAQVHALSGLLKEPSFRTDFLSNKGMEFLLLIFSKEGSQWDAVRVKVAQLVMDNFLDETMGAELGVWPTQPVLENKVCEAQDRMLEDGCWEYNVKKMGRGNWSKDFLKLLKEQRAKSGDSVLDREL